jgi:hypothetical protein
MAGESSVGKTPPPRFVYYADDAARYRQGEKGRAECQDDGGTGANLGVRRIHVDQAPAMRPPLSKSHRGPLEGVGPASKLAAIVINVESCRPPSSEGGADVGVRGRGVAQGPKKPLHGATIRRADSDHHGLLPRAKRARQLPVVQRSADHSVGSSKAAM